MLVKQKTLSSSKASNGPTVRRVHTSSTTSPTAALLSTETPASITNFDILQQFAGVFGPLDGQSQLGTGPPTPHNSGRFLCPSERSESADNLETIERHSVSIFGYPSHPPSFIRLSRGFTNVVQNRIASRSVVNQCPLSLGVSQTRGAPVIHKIIPNQGPKFGGVEVSLLGAGFSQGLEVWFGKQKAITTTYWGDTSVVCLLPFSPVTGIVVVTFKHQRDLEAKYFVMGGQLATFKYVEDDEGMLVRTALSVLGRNMSGPTVDAIDLARRILNDGS
jgi:hypothetical protein